MSDDQQAFVFDLAAERVKRDAALAKLKANRSDVIAVAFNIAQEIARKRGTVTSTDVLNVLRSNPDLRHLLVGKDPRFMGPVFRRKGWKRVGWRAEGSHGRPVAVWTWAG